jgi:hypothetical protein
MHAAEILESHLAYIEAGDGNAVVVFLHGNPRARSEAVLSLLRSGRFPLASTESATE